MEKQAVEIYSNPFKGRKYVSIDDYIANLNVDIIDYQKYLLEHPDLKKTDVSKYMFYKVYLASLESIVQDLIKLNT
jgi:hypothetical protein